MLQSVWNWIQRYKLKKITSKRKKIDKHIVDETLIKVGLDYIWLWIAIEPENRRILAVNISKERNMFVVERKISLRFSQDSWQSSSKTQYLES